MAFRISAQAAWRISVFVEFRSIFGITLVEFKKLSIWNSIQQKNWKKCILLRKYRTNLHDFRIYWWKNYWFLKKIEIISINFDPKTISTSFFITFIRRTLLETFVVAFQNKLGKLFLKTMNSSSIRMNKWWMNPRDQGNQKTFQIFLV